MNLRLKYVTADEREKLYNEVWTDPVVKVAKRYDLSDNGLRNRCKRLGIPLPYVGYWAKLRAGKKVKKTPLPEVTGEVKEYVRNYAIKYKTDIEELTEQELNSAEELGLLCEETKNLIRETCSKIKVKGQLRNPHELIIQHKEEMKYRNKREKELKKARFNIDYNNEVKSEYRKNNTVLPIDTSKSNINRAYRIIDAIIKTIEKLEGHVNISQFSKKDEASIVVMNSSFDFELKEINRKRITEGENKKKASLLLQLQAPSRPYYYSGSSYKIMKYKDKKNQSLENQVGNIVLDIFIEANKVNALNELNRREIKRKWEEEESQRYLEKIRKDELAEMELLSQASSDWDKAQKIREFTESMELKIRDIKDEYQKGEILRWIKWARDKADWLDPLVEKEDDLLGKSKTIFEKIINDSIGK